jgi:putative ABC transport system substrate-binding protein
MAAMIAAPPFGESQATQPGTRRIGIISAGSVRIPLNDVFEEALRTLGWSAGQNLTIDFRLARLDQGATPADISALAAAVADRGAEVIVCYSAIVTQAVKAATKTPICFGFVGDPVGARLVASLAQPGGNVTGVSYLVPELGGKWVQLLKEAMPGLTRVGILVNPANSGSPPLVSDAQRAAARLGTQPQVREVTRLEDLERAFSEMVKDRTEAVIPMPDTMFFFHRRRVIELAAMHRLPDIHDGLDLPKAGALMAYGEAFDDHIRRQALHVDKLLRGAKPSNLPVGQPTHFKLVINLKTARARAPSRSHRRCWRGQTR